MGLIYQLGLLLCLGLLSCVPAVESQETFIPSGAIAQSTQGQQLPITAEARVRGNVIQLEVARTPEQQALGLMFRPQLPDHRGMLFPYSTPQQVRYWMKDVPVSLDMVFLYQGKIVAIAANVPPCQHNPCPTYGPDLLVDHVLEVRGGLAQQLGLRVGDPVQLRFLAPHP